MHYHCEVWVEKKEGYKKEVKEILEPYSENVEVAPRKEYLDDDDIKRMKEHYKIKETSELASKMKDWRGTRGGYDDKGLFHWSTYNPESFWDWWVIGGRWSGEHTNWLLKAKYGDKMKLINEEFEKNYGWFTGGKANITEEQRAKQYEKVFRKHIPNFKGLIPAWRDTYKQDGFDDDIIAVKDIPVGQLDSYTLILPSGVYHSQTWNGKKFIDSDKKFTDLLKEVKGKGYLVTVDYHC